MEGVTGLFICLVFIAPVYTYTLIELFRDEFNVE